jgi:tetratricopeptide (TPR) repeat protein
MRHVLLTLVILLTFPVIVAACLWDSDTLRMERQRFPQVLELITGKFLRHSPEYYQWRIQDRLKKLQADPNNLALLDDLGVSYVKTGQHDKAIETGVKTLALKPRRYESESNLGTFYFFAGHLENSIEHIRKAIQINPDAHFGREVYQLRLFEYLLARKVDGKLSQPIDGMGSSKIIQALTNRRGGRSTMRS